MKESKIFRLRDNDGNILIESDDPLEFLFLLGKLEEEEEEEEKPCCDKCGSCRTCCEDECDDEDADDDDDEDEEDDDYDPEEDPWAVKEIDLSDLFGDDETEEKELFRITLNPQKIALAAAVACGFAVLRRLWKRRR